MSHNAENGLRRWLREWWVTLRYGSRLTKAGRVLRTAQRDGWRDIGDPSAWVEVDRPGRVTPPAEPDGAA